MGYSTEFTGVLKFKNELTATDLNKLNSFFGKDRRDLGYTDDSIYEEGKYGGYINWYYFNLKLANDFSGIEWDGSEKTIDLESIVNFLIDKSGVDLQLEGELLAQGDDFDDRWRLIMKDGRAVKEDFPRTGQHVVCPFCEKKFTLKENPFT